MTIKQITNQDKEAFNSVVNHPLQSYEWGEFREKTGVKVIRRGIFDKDKLVDGLQLTIHPIPHTSWTIGYLPKGTMPTKEMISELIAIGKEERCVFIQLEPNIIKSIHGEQTTQEPTGKKFLKFIADYPEIVSSAHPLFTKYNFLLDISESEETLLKNMHPKTRYNIKVAKKHNVEITEDNSEHAFETYWRLMEETTTRQRFYAHTKRYHKLQWEIFPHTQEKGRLSSHLFLAKYDKKILTTMLFFVFQNRLYYPYGASSNEHRNVMHSTLTMWEAILFGKKLGLQSFDMWGALKPDPDPKDPWFGFHDFKRKYGPQHVEFVGSYDLVIKPSLYKAYTLVDKLRWAYLKLRK